MKTIMLEITLDYMGQHGQEKEVTELVNQGEILECLTSEVKYLILKDE